MTFAATEASADAGRPFNLYLFRFGTGANDFLAYTNLTDPFEFDISGGIGDPQVVTFAAEAIIHGDVTASGTLDKTTVPVTAPDVGDLASLYAGEGPQQSVVLTIWQGHVGDADIKVGFSGRVISASFGDGKIELDVEPVGTSLQRSGLTRNWQYACPLVLYGAQCKANRGAATRTTTVSTVTGPLLTLPSNWAPADLKAKHQGGVFAWLDANGRTVRRSIESVDVNSVRLSSFVEGLVAGASVTVTLGCNHLMDDCAAVHNNIQNFGGQPQIPLKNPVGVTNSFY